MQLSRRDLLKAGAMPWIPGFAMKAGTAKVEVTPTQPQVHNFEPNHPAAAYHPMHARCLSLFDGRKRLVIVTYDFNGLDVATPILRERAERELGVPPSCLALLATHNHHAPFQIARENFAYGRWLAEKIYALIQEAIRNEDGPAELSFGSGSGYFIHANGSAHADYEVQLLQVVRKGRQRCYSITRRIRLSASSRSTGPRIRDMRWTKSKRASRGRWRFMPTLAEATNTACRRRA